jgi:hypothetical protein
MRINLNHWCLLLLVVNVWAGCSSAVAQPQFPNPVYKVGNGPYGLARADIDGDGIQDLVTASFDGLAILLGRGDGTFADALSLLAIQEPVTVFAADINSDGQPDLLLQSFMNSSLSFNSSRINLGGNTFGPEETIATSGADLQPGDFNGDGQVDLLLRDWDGQPFYRVLLGTGDGHFVPAAMTSSAVGLNDRAVVADMDGDGRSDIIATSYIDGQSQATPTDLVVLRGLGNGSFEVRWRMTLPAYGDSPLVGHFDGDGHVDVGVNLVRVSDPLGNGVASLALLFGHGDGTLEPGPELAVQLTWAVTTGDFNRDGLGDFATTDETYVHVFLGQGNRDYSALRPFYGGGVRMLTGDFDRDGVADLALLSNYDGAVFLYEGNGDGTFGPAPIEALQDAALQGIATADFNGDGRLDLAVGRYVADDVSILLGNGAGGFGAETRFPAGISPQVVVPADLNRDGRQDLAVLDFNYHDYTGPVSGSISVLFGSGDGTFLPPVDYPTGLSPIALAVGDLNGDGFPDMAVANTGDPWSIPGAAGDLRVFLNDGAGGFGAPLQFPLDVHYNYPYGWTIPVSLAIGDVSGDLRTDVVVAITGQPAIGVPSEVSLLGGNGNGSLQAGVTIATGYEATSVAIGDIDSDGDFDVVFVDPGSYSFDSGGVSLILADGRNGFQAGSPIRVGVGPQDVDIEDFDGDAIPDLAVASGYLTLLHGNGDGTFNPSGNYGLFGIPSALLHGDFNQDGLPDIMAASSSGVVVLRNQLVPPIRVDVLVSFGSGLGRGSGVVSWHVSAEWDLLGFNVLEIDNHGNRRRINVATIPCVECVTGGSADYSLIIPKHRSGRNLYVEMIHRDRTTEVFGPALKQ